nr:DUF4082 domain-containing protein [Micromonospora sp. DSM 115978]
MVTAFADGAEADTYSFFADADVSRAAVDPDVVPVELGLRFAASGSGELTAVRFLKAKGDRGSHPVTVWSGAGVRLATTTSGNESRSGWQQVELPEPVRIEAGEQYVVSYHTSRYRVVEDFFTARPVTAGPLSTVGTAGVYAYGDGGFPTEVYRASNYWVDVVFEADAEEPGAPPSSAPPTAAPSATASASPTASPTPTSTAPTGRPVTLDLPRIPWEGGPAYYGSFPAAQRTGWTNPSFFPIGVWYESVVSQEDVDKDKAVGLNTYVMLTDTTDVELIRRNGMSAIIPEPFRNRGDESVGWILGDEADMWGGPGNGTWTGNYPGQGPICTSSREGCGLDVMRRESASVPAGETGLRYANYGKGVMFWQSDSDAGKFVNGFSSVVSNDIYWYTDPYVCTAPAEGPSKGVTRQNCRRAANYGLTMERMRELDALDGKRQPVWAFVEVGHPFTEDDAPTINGDQIAGAVMSSLIHEARGIQYFNHNFGGSCISQHVLRDRCGAGIRPAVTELNKRVTSLAPVLNTQSYAWEFNPGLDTMLKAHDGSFYVFSMLGSRTATGSHKLALPPELAGSRAEVLFENRTVPVVNGAIQDNFAAEHTYHIYKITP